MKNYLSKIILLTPIILLISCEKIKEKVEEMDVKTYIVISDIHLGDQRSINEQYCWSTTQQDTLKAFLDYLKDSVKWNELIIAGDFIDEWVAPTSYTAFADTAGTTLTERQFFEGVIASNKSVIDKFYALRSPQHKLVYIPGNHDMNVTKEDFDAVLPDLFEQARTPDITGMGEYQPDAEIYIEHGHRYDIFNAPYTGNVGVDTIPEGNILPPGYFISKLDCDSKIAAQQTLTKAAPSLDDITYNLAWTIMGGMYGEKDVATGLDGMHHTYTFADYAGSNGLLYNGIDKLDAKNDGWETRCKRLGAYNVPSVTTSVLSILFYDFCDKMALDVLTETDFKPHIIVWGHSHEPKLIQQYRESDNSPCLYVNTGCWVNGKIAGSENTATFCMITTTNTGTYKVKLCRFSLSSGKPSIEILKQHLLHP